MDYENMLPTHPHCNPADYVSAVLDSITDNDIGDFETIDEALLSVVSDDEASWMAERVSGEVRCG